MQHNPLLERASSRLRVFRVYQRAVSYFRPDWPWILLLLALIGVITASQLLTPWPIAVLVDSVLASEPKDDWVHRVFLAILPDGRLGQVIGLALIGLALKVFQDLCTMMRTIVNHRIDYSGLLRVRRDLYRKLQALHLGYHHSRPLGDAIYRLSTDTYGCQAILSVLISTSVAVVTLGSMLFILLSRDVTLTLLALSVTPFLVAANVRFGRTLKACSLEAKETDTHVVSTVQRSIGAIGLVQAFCREKDELKRFHHAVETSIRAWLRFNWQQVVYWLIVGTVFGLGTAA
ncbi:MAG TPA: ABC transporter transmembrane domain-containing protein, partial [Planctomycetota bacterium]|nr:ABC transporter transmembrane domain-containing protein [Planctomycetota bacterium]